MSPAEATAPRELDPFDLEYDSLLDAEPGLVPFAKLAVSRGFHIFPLRPKGKLTLPGSHGFKDSKAPSDPNVLEPWKQNPDFNIGIDLGASDLCVLDFDNGEKDIPEWLNQTKTFKVKTARGLHIYFRGARPTTGLFVNTLKVGDIKSTGGYVLAAGSIHPDGPVYTVIDDSPIAPLPDISGLVKQEKERVNASVDGPLIFYGSHDRELFRIGCLLRNAGMNYQEIRDALVNICVRRCENYGSDYVDMCEKKAKSASKYPVGQASPVLVFEKAVQLASISTADTPIEIPSGAEVQTESAANTPQDAEDAFAEGDKIADFDDAVITGEFRNIVDAVCLGTTIPRQYALLAVKSIACSMLTKHKVVLEGCESSRSYFIVFGETGTGKGLAFRRNQKIVDATQNLQEYVKIIHAVDSEAGLRDAFFDIPPEKNHPILFFVDEIKTLGHKADGKKNPEIVDAIIELANNPTISRTKAKRTVAGKASKTREDAHLLLYACAQDGEAFANAFPRTKMQGLPDRFIPEYSPKVTPGDLPDVNTTNGANGYAKLLANAAKNHQITMAPGIQGQINELWASQETEFRQSPRLRQQFLLEMYLAAFSRGSAVAERQDLDIAAKVLDRQKAIRRKFFADEIPNQVGIYSNRLKAIYRDMQRRLRLGRAIGDVAMSLRDLMTQTLAYKENDLPSFNLAWKAQSTFFLECKVTSKKNGHVYKKFVPVPEESDMWLSAELAQGKAMG